MVLTDLIVDGNTSAVGPDYASGTRQALEHLVGLGHRDVGFVGFPNSEKYQTFWQKLEQLDLRYNPQLGAVPAVAGCRAGHSRGVSRDAGDAGRRVIADSVARDERLGGDGHHRSAEAGRYPGTGQVSVIGYDDLGRDQNPPLTTIRSYPEEVGRIAAKMLMENWTERRRRIG